jgi:NADPH2:quinone reductase
VLGFNLSFLFKRRDLFDQTMDEILGWVAAGSLVLPAITTFPLAEAGRAHAAIESAQTVGKLVLLPP